MRIAPVVCNHPRSTPTPATSSNFNSVLTTSNRLQWACACAQKGIRQRGKPCRSNFHNSLSFTFYHEPVVRIFNTRRNGKSFDKRLNYISWRARAIATLSSKGTGFESQSSDSDTENDKSDENSALALGFSELVSFKGRMFKKDNDEIFAALKTFSGYETGTENAEPSPPGSAGQGSNLGSTTINLQGKRRAAFLNVSARQKAFNNFSEDKKTKGSFALPESEENDKGPVAVDRKCDVSSRAVPNGKAVQNFGKFDCRNSSQGNLDIADENADQGVDSETSSEISSFLLRLKAKEFRKEESHPTKGSAKHEDAGVDFSALDPESGLAEYNRKLRQGNLEHCIQILSYLDEANLLNMNQIYHGRFFEECKRQKNVQFAVQFLNMLPSVKFGVNAVKKGEREEESQGRVGRREERGKGGEGAGVLRGLVEEDESWVEIATMKQSNEANKELLRSFTQLLSVCAHCGDYEAAFRGFALAQKLGVKADVILYTSLLSACCKAGKIDLGFKVFHEMQAKRVEPNVKTYSALIHGCARAKQVAKAFGIYGIMLSKKLTPDRVLFNSLISACSQSQALDRAFDVLLEMKGADVAADAYTMAAIVDVCVRSGESRKGLKVYRAMRGKGFPSSREVKPVGDVSVHRTDGSSLPSSKSYVGMAFVTPHLYTAAINACKQEGLWEEAVQIFSDMRDDGVLADEVSFSALIDVACSVGKPLEAFRLLDDMQSYGLEMSSVTYTTLMGVCKKFGFPDIALQLYERVKEREDVPSLPLVNSLLETLCRHGRLDRALAVAEEVKREWRVKLDRHSYNALLSACRDEGRVDFAFQLFHCSQLESVRVSLVMCEAMIDICLRRIEFALPPPQFSFLIGYSPSAREIKTQNSAQQWACVACAIFQHTVRGGVVPTRSLLSKLFQCLRLEYLDTVENAKFLSPAPETAKLSSLEGESEAATSALSGGQGREAKERGIGGIVSDSGREKEKRPSVSSHPYHFPSHAVSPATSSSPSLFSPSPSFSRGLTSFAPSVPPSPPPSVLFLSATSPLPWNNTVELFDERAFKIYKEASSLGAVPKVPSSSGPALLDMREMPTNVAQVFLLSFLMKLALKHAKAPGVALFPVTVLLSTNKIPCSIPRPARSIRWDPPANQKKASRTPSSGSEEERETGGESEREGGPEKEAKRLEEELRRRFVFDARERGRGTAWKGGEKGRDGKLQELSLSSKTGQSISALLRQLGLSFHGFESSGKLTLSSTSVQKWLRNYTQVLPSSQALFSPLSLLPSTASVQDPADSIAVLGGSRIPRGPLVGPGGALGFGKGPFLASQQRAIRMGPPGGVSVFEGPRTAPKYGYSDPDPYYEGEGMKNEALSYFEQYEEGERGRKPKRKEGGEQGDGEEEREEVRGLSEEEEKQFRAYLKSKRNGGGVMGFPKPTQNFSSSGNFYGTDPYDDTDSE